MAWTEAARAAALETRKRHEAENRGGMDHKHNQKVLNEQGRLVEKYRQVGITNVPGRGGVISDTRQKDIKARIASLDSNMAGRTARVESRMLKKELASGRTDTVKVMDAHTGRHVEMSKAQVRESLKSFNTQLKTGKLTPLRKQIINGQIGNLTAALKRGK